MNQLSIGKVAARTGCNIETIRFYEKQGLLTVPDRTEGGHRIYSGDQVKRLIFIRRCRELGFSMETIRQFLSIVDADRISCKRVKRITDDHIRDIRLKIKDLKKMEDTLSELSRLCSGREVPDCPIIDALQNSNIRG